ncbi:Trk system potassium transporter TrkA [Pelagibacteraceae bacterium]|nr:Trk system potassium transporter TrkA [Pelagibacteraceae bacterium]
MKIIICGAGKVGTSIARHLVDQGSDVTVIDSSHKLIDDLREKVDLKTVIGSASNPSVLKNAGAEDSDMIIAVTLQDEINMVACQMAHTFFKIPRKIARLRTEDFLNPIWRDLYNADNMPIDLIISPELEVARSIERQLKAPGAYDVVPFLNDEIELLSLVINEKCPLVDTSLINIHELFQENADTEKNLRASILGISRDERLFIPKKQDTLTQGDHVYIMVDKNHVKRTMSAFGYDEKPIQKLIIIGGGNIGFNLAKDLEKYQSDISVSIVENNEDRSKYIADQLSNTLVLNGDGLDQDLLDEANIKDADLLLALTNDDETNIIISAVARKNKCESIIIVNNSEYNKLKDVLGISKVVDPRKITVSKILKHIHKGKIESVFAIDNNQAEIIHAQVLKSSKLINKNIEDADFPNGLRVGLIKKEDKIIIPEKDTKIEIHDEILFLCMRDDIKKAEELFQVRSEY